MQTIREFLSHRPDEIWFVAPDASVFDALQLMADRDVGAVLVIQDGKLVGIVSERDCARKVVLAEKNPKATLVGEIMSDHVLYVTSDDTLEDCMMLMVGKQIRHLPVLEAGDIIGIVTIRDLIREVSAKTHGNTVTLETRELDGAEILDKLRHPPEGS